MSAKRAAAEVHVALLRGINVGGKNKLAMRDLVALVEFCGGANVRTYIQSGNVVFAPPAGRVRGLGDDISRRLLERHRLAIPVITRTADELRALAAANPFLREGADPAHCHVMFLLDRPAPARIAKLDPQRSPPDRFVVAGRELYLHCPNGMARTKLTNVWLDSSLATVSTARNWNTVLKLIELSSH